MTRYIMTEDDLYSIIINIISSIEDFDSCWVCVNRDRCGCDFVCTGYEMGGDIKQQVKNVLAKKLKDKELL